LYTLFSRQRIVDIDIRTLEDLKLLKIKGRITLGAGVDRLRETLEDLLSSGSNRWVLDVSEVGMIDSSGIGLLVRFLTTAKQQGGALKLLKPTKFALQSLRMIGVINLFETFENQDEAVSSFESH